MKKKRGLGKILIHGSIILYLTFLLVSIVLGRLKFAETDRGNIFRRADDAAAVADSGSLHVGFQRQRVMRSMWNSTVVGVVSTLIVIALAVPSAYALVRYKSVANNAMMGWILTSQIFPVILIMIPLYVLLRRMGLTDSLSGLTLVYVVWALPFVLWMLHGYIKSIPIELEEAASMDGASRLQVIYLVIMPLLLPAIGASALFAFVSAWNEFFFALVLMKSPELVTLQVELARYTGMEGQARTGPTRSGECNCDNSFCRVVCFLRKWFTAGLVSGAMKG